MVGLCVWPHAGASLPFKGGLAPGSGWPGACSNGWPPRLKHCVKAKGRASPRIIRDFKPRSGANVLGGGSHKDLERPRIDAEEVQGLIIKSQFFTWNHEGNIRGLARLEVNSPEAPQFFRWALHTRFDF